MALKLPKVHLDLIIAHILPREIGLEHIFKSRFGTLHIVLVDLVPCTPSKLCFAWGTPS
jgi:hypothetical protein